MVSKLAAPFYIPTRNEWGFQFSTSSPTFITHLFNYSYLNGCEVCLTSVLICTYEMLSDAESFSCAYWPFLYLFGRNVYSDPLRRSGYLSFAGVFCIFWIQVPDQIYDFQTFSFITGTGLSFYFLHSVLRITKFLILKSNLFFVIRVFGVIRKNLLPNLVSQGFMSTF